MSDGSISSNLIPWYTSKCIIRLVFFIVPHVGSHVDGGTDGGRCTPINLDRFCMSHGRWRGQEAGGGARGTDTDSPSMLQSFLRTPTLLPSLKKMGTHPFPPFPFRLPPCQLCFPKRSRYAARVTIRVFIPAYPRICQI